MMMPEYAITHAAVKPSCRYGRPTVRRFSTSVWREGKGRQ